VVKKDVQVEGLGGLVLEQKAALKKAVGVSRGKDECQVQLKGKERNYWMGTEIGMLGGYGL